MAAPRASVLPVAIVLLLMLPDYGIVFFLGLLLFIYRRKRQLGRLSFPPRGLGPVPRFVEDVQDLAAYLSPGVTTTLNLSVGTYRIKPWPVARRRMGPGRTSLWSDNAGYLALRHPLPRPHQHVRVELREASLHQRERLQEHGAELRQRDGRGRVERLTETLAARGWRDR